MKLQTLPLLLLLGACQAPDTASSEPLVTPAAQEEAAVTDRLPRRIHLDRSEHAVRVWVRDRS